MEIRSLNFEQKPTVIKEITAFIVPKGRVEFWNNHPQRWWGKDIQIVDDPKNVKKL